MQETNKNLHDKDPLEQIKILSELNNQLTDELKQVNKKLEESESLKSHFVSNITNEIINPFTSIIGLSKSILSVKKEDWKRVITMVAMIHSEAFNLDFQLRNIFVAAKIEAGEISAEISKVNVNQVVRNVIDQFSIESKKKNIQVELINNLPVGSQGAYFYSDAEKIKTIVCNLLSNAIKFSYNDGSVSVEISEADESLVIRVKDHGTGISEGNQKVIFDRFKRVDSGINSINRGHGLGLSVIKALLDILDGKIKISSEKEKGAEFIITIPSADSETIHLAMSGSEFLFDDMGGEEIF